MRRPAVPLAPTAPLALWLALQLAAILIAVLRVPLAAQYPEPAEQMAIYLLSGTQVIAAGLMFPFFLRDGRCAVIIVSGWPFLLAAGYLAGMTPTALLLPAAFISTWLATLALWATASRTPRERMTAAAMVSFLTLGGAVLRYLRLEFAVLQNPSGFRIESISPLLSTWAAVEQSNALPGWLLLAVLTLAGVAMLVLRTRHGSSPSQTPSRPNSL